MRSKRAVINIVSSVILQIVTIISGFIIPKLIISAYGSSTNGLVTSITQFLGFIVFLEAGFGPVIIASLFRPIANKDKDTIEKILKASEKIFRTISLLFVAYIAILCVLLPNLYKNEFDGLITISLIVIISISTFSEYFFGMTYTLFLKAEQKSYVIFLLKSFSFVANVIVVFILVKLGANIQTVKLVSTFIFIVRPVLQNIYVKKKYNISFKAVDGNYKIKQKWDALAQHIASIVHSNTDVAILTLFGNLAEISVYSVYAMVTSKLRNVIHSFSGGIDAAFGDMIAKGEGEKLNKSFGMYEVIYLSIATIVFSATLFLLVPFVEVYTKGVNDANYLRPVFAYFIVSAEFFGTIRLPYEDLIKVAGRFKETRIGAWVEAFVNIVVSLVLFNRLGIVGLAVGTLVAMLIRTIEFMCYASKHILQRNVLVSLKNAVVICFEVLLIFIIMNFITKGEVYSYGSWGLYAVYVVMVSAVVVLLINAVVYKGTFRDVFSKYFNVYKG